MQTAGYFVVRRVELASRVQHGEHNLDCGHLLAVDHLVVHRNAAAVVDDRNRVVHVNRHIDPSGVAAQSFVDRIIHDLVDEVVQTLLGGRADVHGGAQPYGRKTFEHRDVFRRVASAGFRRFGGGRDREGLVGIQRIRG
jgi:ribulose 1,5-bisphosphate synthetase/thiazole synthase